LPPGKAGSWKRVPIKDNNAFIPLSIIMFRVTDHPQRGWHVFFAYDGIAAVKSEKNIAK